jgi:hypothetical protein
MTDNAAQLPDGRECQGIGCSDQATQFVFASGHRVGWLCDKHFDKFPPRSMKDDPHFQRVREKAERLNVGERYANDPAFKAEVDRALGVRTVEAPLGSDTVAQMLDGPMDGYTAEAWFMAARDMHAENERLHSLCAKYETIMEAQRIQIENAKARSL